MVPMSHEIFFAKLWNLQTISSLWICMINSINLQWVVIVDRPHTEAPAAGYSQTFNPPKAGK